MKRNKMGLYEVEVNQIVDVYGLRVKCVRDVRHNGCPRCALWSHGVCRKIACIDREREDSTDVRFIIA